MPRRNSYGDLPGEVPQEIREKNRARGTEQKTHIRKSLTNTLYFEVKVTLHNYYSSWMIEKTVKTSGNRFRAERGIVDINDIVHKGITNDDDDRIQ